MVKRIILISCGWLCLALGVIGIFLPVMPTTVFLLMASWCFAKSSDRFHRWLHEHPKLGPIVQTWSDGKGIPKHARTKAVVTIVVCMSISILIVGKLWVAALLVFIGIGVVSYLYYLPVLDESSAINNDVGDNDISKK